MPPSVSAVVSRAVSTLQQRGGPLEPLITALVDASATLHSDKSPASSQLLLSQPTWRWNVLRGVLFGLALRRLVHCHAASVCFPDAAASSIVTSPDSVDALLSEWQAAVCYSASSAVDLVATQSDSQRLTVMHYILTLHRCAALVPSHLCRTIQLLARSLALSADYLDDDTLVFAAAAQRVRSALSVTAMAPAPYYGFALNGNSRFVLGDLSVSHNSNLICRLCKDETFAPADGRPDVTLDEEKTVLNVDGKHIQLTLRDTAGTERFRTISSNFYRGVDCVVLAFALDARESFINVRTVWRAEAERYAPEGCIKVCTLCMHIC